MWRITTSIFGFVIDSTYDSLQGCIDELHRQWNMMGFDNMDWYLIEEFFDNKWFKRGFQKMDEQSIFFI